MFFFFFALGDCINRNWDIVSDAIVVYCSSDSFLRIASMGGDLDLNKSRNKRVAFVLIDGLGDVSIPRYGYKTPLQVAKTPSLDAIAAAGVNGLMDPVEPGLACGSDTAHLSLLGYDPRVYYCGRGAFESMGAGLVMSPGDIAFKVIDFFY